ncbi:hypothetical protein ABZP36_010419 [Zizania latifolia]
MRDVGEVKEAWGVTRRESRPNINSSCSFLCSLAAASASASFLRHRVAIAVYLSDESVFAVKWGVQNSLCPVDTVMLLHVRPTSNWGSIPVSVDGEDADALANALHDER